MSKEVKKAGHTPGPWSFDKPYDGEINIYFDDMGEGVPDAVVYLSDAEDDNSSENARLIAAAPELMAACRGINEWHDLIKQNYPEMLGPFKAVRAAIAKAEGRT
ncbi:MAG: hypothetical protein PHC68_02695 [Syntrophorhabdaceae bacterium]|nr:hypothetical protein [Syntrophorhabdaceae bacterium]